MKFGRWLELDNESHQPCDQCHGSTGTRYRVPPEQRWRCPQCFIGWLQTAWDTALERERARHGDTPQI